MLIRKKISDLALQSKNKYGKTRNLYATEILTRNQVSGMVAIREQADSEGERYALRNICEGEYVKRQPVAANAVAGATRSETSSSCT